MYATATNVQTGHNFVPTIVTNGHVQQQQQPQRPTQPQNTPREPINVVGIPSVYIENNHLVVGSSQSSSTRSYTPLKVLGDGSFGTVWLCDWHGTLPPNTPLSPMQCGAGARPEWTGKRLVAVKRMKKKWEGGWDECQKLKEIESLRAIPFHPNIIPLYDFFLLPASKELYFVFESMEGNLYHLIKARKHRALAGGLVSSIFRQIVAGLDHIHTAGYFHRDMKPENVLVTTTGLFDYVSLSPIAPPNSPPEKDVITIIKLADFGLARETQSQPPYTEYVSTRWYRAPEVLLYSRDYSNPVDMWALGTIMAELVNLRPLFPGIDQIDQVARICEVLGDPCDDYYSENVQVGGGPWPRGIKMAKDLGFQFQKMPPKDIFSLFERTVPTSLICCIRDLLKYDPDARLTSKQCLEHTYLLETTPRNNIPLPPSLRVSTSLPTSLSPNRNVSPVPHSSSNHPHFSPSSNQHRTPFFPSNSAAVPPLEPRHRGWPQPSSIPDDAMDVSPGESSESGHPMDIHSSPVAQDFPARPNMESDPSYDSSEMLPSSGNKLPKLFGKKHSRWGLGMFGGDRSNQHNGLPPVHEMPPVASTSTSSLQRVQTSSSGSRSLRDPSPQRDVSRMDMKKMNKKEAERLQREAEKQRRALAEKNHREQARAVMQKRNQILVKKDEIEWSGGSGQRLWSEPDSRLEFSESIKGKQAATGPIRQNHTNGVPSITVSAAAGRFGGQGESPYANSGDWRRDERLSKARRIDFDDDQSMSSSDVHSTGRMSTISFATVDSDPGPSRIRNRPSLFALNRMQSASSLRTSFDEFAPSARSSNSLSLEGQLAHDFFTQASVDPAAPSPPPLQMLSISPPLSPSPPWMQLQQLHQETLASRRDQAPPYVTIAGHQRRSSPKPPYDFNGHDHPPNPYGYPNGHTAKSEINPIFKVPPLPDEEPSSPTSLPPFSELEAVAGAGYDYPPLSPMSFTTPEDA
ncbi:kinase-like domain-containing protein [Mycena floridula]|nr:kinase-like domain-containing protein [Mycena floridula]